MAATKSVIPFELKGRISPSILTVVETNGFWRAFGIGLSILMLYGPVWGQPDHNGIRYIVGPFAFPCLGAIYYTLRPFRPYRGTIFVERTRDIDTTDPLVMRLVEIYKSPAARRFLWLSTTKMAFVQLVCMGFLTVLVRHSLHWTLVSPWFWAGAVGCSLFSWIALSSEYVAWGLRKWAMHDF
jgi:hypothetical protein